MGCCIAAAIAIIRSRISLRWLTSSAIAASAVARLHSSGWLLIHPLGRPVTSLGAAEAQFSLVELSRFVPLAHSVNTHKLMHVTT
jgi:hypothetical protein